MLQIQNALVSLDVIEKFFVCNLDKCLGECCIEGDAGAPITEQEYAQLKEILPEVYADLLPAARQRIDEAGVAYVDEEGDLVTQIVEGRNCVFTCYGEGGMCMCAIEKAYRGVSTSTSQFRVTSIHCDSPTILRLLPSTIIVGKSARQPKCSAVPRVSGCISS